MGCPETLAVGYVLRNPLCAVNWFEMFLIDKGGRKRAICRECRKIHAKRDCPRQKRSTYPSPEVRAFCERADAFREWVRRQEA